MKKLIAVIMILAMIVPATACGVASWLVEGSWNHFEYTDNGMLLTSIYLDEGGKAYFVTQLFSNDEPSIGRAFVGSWEMTGSNTVHIVTGKNSSIDLTYYTYNMMFDDSAHNYYFRAELGEDDPIK